MLRILKSKTVCPLMALLVGLFFIFGILSCVAVGGSGAREGALHQLQFNVGYQVFDLKYRRDEQEQALTVAVWYPTAARSKPHNYGGPTSGNVAVDATPLAEGGLYPVLVFSHGYGGSGLGAVFFTAALAARGWIVVCPDHHDKHSAVRIRSGQDKDFDRLGLLRHAKEIANSGLGDRNKYLYRLDEMKLVLDRMLTSYPFGKLIDKDRVAVGGHSFGGYTALGLSGTIKDRHDTRIKAVLLFSTGAGGYLFTEEELRRVKIPSMLFMGEKEKHQRRGKKTMSEISDKIYRSMSSPKYFMEVRGANHFSFNNRFADNWRTKLLSGTPEQFDVIQRYSIAFLEKYVAGRKDSSRVLEQTDPMLTSYNKELSPDRSRRDANATTNRMQSTEQGAALEGDSATLHPLQLVQSFGTIVVLNVIYDGFLALHGTKSFG